MMRIMLASLAAAALAAVPSMAASTVTAYGVTINGSCATIYPTSVNGRDAIVIHVGNDTVNLGPSLADKFINEGGYFWWLPTAKYPLEPTAPSSLVTPDAVKVYLAHGTCEGDTTTTTSTTTTTTTTPAPRAKSAYFCVLKTGKPLVAPATIVSQRLISKKAFSPYWVVHRLAGATNLGAGHLVCSIPAGMTKDGIYRDATGKSVAAKAWMTKRAGYYPELKKR